MDKYTGYQEGKPGAKDSRPKATIEDKLKEKLAAIEHERWADWQRWCHQVLRDNIKPANFALHVKPVLARWEKQIATPYHKLSDAEKASDMEQVDRYWPLLQDYVNDLVSKRLEASIDLSNPQIKAIITTETTRALLANEKELTRRLKLLQKDFKKEQDNNNLVFTYVFDQVRQTANKARLKALQKQQK